MELKNKTLKELVELRKQIDKRIYELQQPEIEERVKYMNVMLEKHYDNCNPSDICCGNCESEVDECDCFICDTICGNCQVMLPQSCYKEKSKLEELRKKNA